MCFASLSNTEKMFKGIDQPGLIINEFNGSTVSKPKFRYIDDISADSRKSIQKICNIFLYK